MGARAEIVKKTWIHVSVILCFIAAVALLMLLDYFNLESIGLFNERGFYFDYTWKGRLFLLFFLWLLILEYLLNLDKLPKIKSGSRGGFRLLASFIFALVPLLYVVSVNFLGLDQTVIQLGETIRGEYWREHSDYWRLILEGDWPVTLEYFVFTGAFFASTLLAYGKEGIRKFALTLGLGAGISVAYMVDVMFPYGVFKPLQALALPTAACAATLLDFLGYRFALSFSPGPDSMPVLMTTANGEVVSIGIAWPCAGVHSLFLYTLITLLMFKKTELSTFRKLIYFVVGAAGTYLVNVLRVTVYFIIRVNKGLSAAQTFHNAYGELLFVAWMLLYILLIVCIEKFRLPERLQNGKAALARLWSRLVSKSDK